MVVQQLLAWSKHESKSIGLRFVDLKAAYYGVVRQLGLDLRSSPEALARLFITLEVSPACVQRLLALLAAGPAAAGVHPHLRELLAEAHRGTWFAMAGAPEVSATERGTRPGDPMADLVFTWIAAERLAPVSARIQERGWAIQLPAPSGPGLSILQGALRQLLEYLGYADDLAEAICGMAEQVPERLAILAGWIVDAFLPAGLRLNFKPRKTAGVAVLRGAGALEARA